MSTKDDDGVETLPPQAATDAAPVRRRSMLGQAMAKALLDHAGIDTSRSPAEERPDDSHGCLLRGRRTSHDEITVTQHMVIKLRPLSPDDPNRDPVWGMSSPNDAEDIEGEEVFVHAMVQVKGIMRVPPGLGDDVRDGSIDAQEAWDAKWQTAISEPSYDDSDVVGPLWQELDMPGYLVPNLQGTKPFDFAQPLEYAMATMPEFTFILPMDDKGQMFGHNDHYIYSWGKPTPWSDKLSDEENEKRRVTVRFRYRVAGWTYGWRPKKD